MAVGFRIAGRVALVTGGGSGIGRAIALGLARAGVGVAIADLDPDRAASVVAEIQQAGGRALGVPVDVTLAGDVEHLVATVEQRLGPVDILVNCAGIWPRTLVAEMAEAEWDRVLAINLKGVFLACRAVLPGMIQRGYGRILTITSDVGVTGAIRGAHYGASKGGINAFTRSLAREVADAGINVNAIAPGTTDTPLMRAGNSPEQIAAKARAMPRGRLAQPEDVVGVALFLASDGANHLTGQVVTLRG